MEKLTLIFFFSYKKINKSFLYGNHFSLFSIFSWFISELVASSCIKPYSTLLTLEFWRFPPNGGKSRAFASLYDLRFFHLEFIYRPSKEIYSFFLKVCNRAHAWIKIAWPKIFKIAWLSTFQRRKVSWDTESSRCYSVWKHFHCHSLLRKAKTRGTLKLFLLLFVPVLVCVVFLQFWFTY